MARRDGYDEAAIEAISMATLQSEGDLSVSERLLAIRDEERRMKRFGAFQTRVVAEPGHEGGVMHAEPRG